MKWLIGLGAAVAIPLIVVFATMPGDVRTYSAPPAMTIDTSKQYPATIEPDKGNLVLELFASDGSGNSEQLCIPGARQVL